MKPSTHVSTHKPSRNYNEQTHLVFVWKLRQRISQAKKPVCWYIYYSVIKIARKTPSAKIILLYKSHWCDSDTSMIIFSCWWDSWWASQSKLYDLSAMLLMWDIRDGWWWWTRLDSTRVQRNDYEIVRNRAHD